MKRLTIILVLFLALHGHATADATGEDDWAELDGPEISNQKPFIEQPKAKPEEPVEASYFRTRVLPYSMVFFLGVSLLTGLLGARSNAKITLAFEEEFCQEPDGILYKQFTRLGKGGDKNKLLVNESASTFKLHAKGHQLLEGAVVSINLRRRHELLSSILESLTGVEDAMCVEFYLKDGVMPPMVLAIASKQNYKELLRTNKDVKALAEELKVDESILKDWPSDQLVVYSEHPSYFYDMMTRPMMAQVFGVAPFRQMGKYFRGLQISSDSNSNHKKIMRWWLSIPKEENMAQLKTIFQAIFAMLHQVNDYKISAERRQKAEKVRQQLASSDSQPKQTPKRK